MIYLILLFLVLLGSFSFNGVNRKSMQTYYILLLVSTVLVFGLRYRVGIDTIRYETFFKSLPPLSALTFDDFQETAYAPFFVLLVSACKEMIPDFTFFEIVHSFILNIMIFSFCWKRSINPFTSIFFYYVIACVYFNTEILRESLAVGVFLLNYKNIEKRKWVKYYLFSLISIGFHYSAVVTLIVPFFSKLRLNKRIVLYTSFYFLLVLMMARYIESGITLSLLAQRYSSATSFKDTNEVSLFYYLSLIIKSFLFVGLLLWVNHRYHIEKNRTIEPMLLLYSIIILTGIVYPLLFDRISNYFILFFILTLSNVIYETRNKSPLIHSMIPVMIMSFYIYLDCKEETLHRYYPYHSVIDKTMEPAREQIFNNEVLLY